MNKPSMARLKDCKPSGRIPFEFLTPIVWPSTNDIPGNWQAALPIKRSFIDQSYWIISSAKNRAIKAGILEKTRPHIPGPARIDVVLHLPGPQHDYCNYVSDGMKWLIDLLRVPQSKTDACKTHLHILRGDTTRDLLRGEFDIVDNSTPTRAIITLTELEDPEHA